MARQLSMATRRELKAAIGQRYRAAGRWERRQLLDEFTRVTGYHRKHALRVLHRPFVPRPPRPRKRIYDEAVRQALALLWEAAQGPAAGADREHGAARAPAAGPGGEKFTARRQRGEYRPVVAPGAGSNRTRPPTALGNRLSHQAERAGADLCRLG